MPLRFSTLYRKTKPPVEISLILGLGRNAEPSERSPKSPAACSLRAEHQRKVLFSFYLPVEASAQAGKKKSVARKSGKAKKTFLWGVPVSGTAAGRLHWGFCSKWVRPRFRISHQKAPHTGWGAFWWTLLSTSRAAGTASILFCSRAKISSLSVFHDFQPRSARLLIKELAQKKGARLHPL